MTAMINATFIHVAVLRYDTVKEKDVHKFWIRCEEDWLRALRCFTIGVTLFMIVLALVGWVAFKHKVQDLDTSKGISYIIVSSLITVVAVTVLMTVTMRTFRKWSDWLRT